MNYNRYMRYTERQHAPSYRGRRYFTEDIDLDSLDDNEDEDEEDEDDEDEDYNGLISNDGEYIPTAMEMVIDHLKSCGYEVQREESDDNNDVLDVYEGQFELAELEVSVSDDGAEHTKIIVNEIEDGQKVLDDLKDLDETLWIDLSAGNFEDENEEDY